MVAISTTNLDKNATYGITGEVHAAIINEFGKRPLGNPSSIHSSGQRARFLIEEARSSVAELVGAGGGDRVIFTSGASEANNCVILGTALNPRAHIITSTIEHPSVLEAVREGARRGALTTEVTVGRSGTLITEDVLSAIRPDTRLISIMYANNETGSVQPVTEIGATLRKLSCSAIFHSDVVQALGKVNFNFKESLLDFASISAHKIGGLAGIGALIGRAGIEITPLIYGGPQEKRARAGTENTIGIFSFGVAARALIKEGMHRYKKLEENREIVWSVIRDTLPGVLPTVDLKNTLPNTLSLILPNINSADLVVALDLEGIEISSGSACASGKPGPSHVMLAMGLSDDEARRVIRISVGSEDSPDSLKTAAQRIVSTIKRMAHE